MSKIYEKAGFQDPDDPMKFVLSTSEVDKMGDIVEQDWDLKDFRKNPIALYQHDSDSPIGVWRNVKVEAGRLVGQLKLAAEGTSPLIDTVRSLVAQRILKAVSVGFRVGDYERLDDTDGYRLKNPRLHEASLVSVPANGSALAIAKSFNLSNDDISRLFEPGVETDPLQVQKNKLKVLKLSARQHVKP